MSFVGENEFYDKSNGINGRDDVFLFCQVFLILTLVDVLVNFDFLHQSVKHLINDNVYNCTL